MNRVEHGSVDRPPTALDTQPIRRTLRQRTHRKPRAEGTAPSATPSTEESLSQAILCAACRQQVTHERERIEVAGSHEHRFFNPHGILFHIGSFRAAPGCLPAGEASLEFTWFPGYAWRLAFCHGCRQHLGWRFEAGLGESFFGLVLNRLIAVATPNA